MTLKHEKRLPYYGFVAGVLLSSLLFWRFGIPSRMEVVLEAFVGLSGIVVGFLGTALTILLSIEGRRVIQQLKTNGVFQILIRYLLTAIHSGIVVGFLTLISLLVDGSIHPKFNFWFTTLWSGFTLFFAIASYRVIHLIAKIVMPDDAEV